jgi:hypothetical protein
VRERATATEANAQIDRAAIPGRWRAQARK